MGLIIESIRCMQPILSRYQQGKAFFYRAGDLTAFMLRFFREVVRPPYEWREIFYQCYLVGYKSTFLIGVAATLSAHTHSRTRTWRRSAATRLSGN